VEFVVEEVALGQVFIPNTSVFPLSSIIAPMLHALSFIYHRLYEIFNN
jgi:hypothetical protein